MKSLFVAWQDPESRQWATVGRLSQMEGRFHFTYTQGAKNQSNFIPFGRMTDLKAEYVSEELFPLFKNRVLAKSRPEYAQYLQWLGLDAAKYDVLDELERTGGIRATDSLEMFPCPTPTEQNNYEVYFFTRGLRHLHDENRKRTSELKEGDKLNVMLDPQNEYDPHALMIRTCDPITLVGYAPRYFSSEFTKLMNRVGAKNVKVTVERVNAEAPLQYRVLCRIQAPWPVNFQICETDEFRSLSKNS